MIEDKKLQEIMTSNKHKIEERIFNGNLEERRQLIDLKKMPYDHRLAAMRANMEIEGNNSSDALLLRKYLLILLSLPHRRSNQDAISIKELKARLDSDHFGLENVKTRILEHIAALAMRDNNDKANRGQIICLDGPPGVGKTSIARSIASALGREFFKIDIGGMDDVYELKGCARSYRGSDCGQIIRGFRNLRYNDPVILLDEIDKSSSRFGNAVHSALLEVLDPSQNSMFFDYFMEIPYDISNAIFIATSNNMYDIFGPLRDRLDIISIDGYTCKEKLEIARRHLVSRSREKSGLSENDVKFTSNSILRLINDYAPEPGVRHMERIIDGISRKVALSKLIGENLKYPVIIDDCNLHEYVSEKPLSFSSSKIRETLGVVNAVGVAGHSGYMMQVEAILSPGSGRMIATGSIKNIMQESIFIARSIALGKAETVLGSLKPIVGKDIHINVLPAAIDKDGRSAGIAFFAAIWSLLANITIPGEVTFSGELTLSGSILPVGGLDEKLAAIKHMNQKTVIIPSRNKPDIDAMDNSSKEGLEFVYVEHIDDVIRYLCRYIEEDKAKMM